MTDPVAQMMRGDRQALIDAAPPLHAARLWHAARRRRADALRARMKLAGWVARVAVSIWLLLSFAAVRPETDFLAFLWALSIWLTWGACAATPRSTNKGLPQ